MKIIKPSYEIMTPIDRDAILKQIELAGRVCYKSENNITSESAPKFVKMMIDNGHEAMIEHGSLTVKFVCCRGISHEIVRHRVGMSYAQESTRYVLYTKEKHGGQITVIKPFFYEEGTTNYDLWRNSCQVAEETYMKLVNNGSTAQEARCVLPTSLKTEIVVTGTFRAWRHFFKLRVPKTAHPQMRELTIPLLKELQEKLPELFCDLMVDV